MKNIFQLVCDAKLCFYYLLIASQDPQFRHFKSLKCFIYWFISLSESFLWWAGDRTSCFNFAKHWSLILALACVILVRVLQWRSFVVAPLVHPDLDQRCYCDACNYHTSTDLLFFRWIDGLRTRRWKDWLWSWKWPGRWRWYTAQNHTSAKDWGMP